MHDTRHSRYLYAAVLVVLSMLGGQGVAGEEEVTLAIKAARLIDVQTGKVVDDPVVIVAGERIKAVGSNLAIPDGVELLDLGERTLLPGLIDAHVHIAGGGGTSAGLARSALHGAANARKTLLAGFTTVRSMGGPGFAGVALRDAINAGDVIGPRILDAGTMLTVTGGHCGGSRLTFGAGPEAPGVADSPADFAQKVREQFKYGADFIKICITGGFVSGTDPSVIQFSEEEVRTVIETAHRYGKTVAVHAYAGGGVKLAAGLGADSIEHASLVDDEGIRLLKRNPRQVVIPTLSVFSTALERAQAVGASPAALVQLQHVLSVYKDNARQLVRAGVPLIYGSDGPAGNNASEFPLLVEVGLTPLQAIQSATIRAAEFLRLQDQVGSVAVGKFADLIAVEGDPLNDITALSGVFWVLKGGVVYKDGDVGRTRPL